MYKPILDICRYSIYVGSLSTTPKDKKSVKIGLQICYQNHPGMADADMFRKETQLAIEAEAMGCEFVGLVEHHFGDYAMCPDNAQLLAGIDAPELPGHCRPGRKCAPGDPVASTESLRRIVGVASLICRQADIDVYGRRISDTKAHRLLSLMTQP